MKRSDLPRATACQDRIDLIETGLSRCGAGVFKDAFLVIQGAAHGAEGVDGRPQQAQTTIKIDQEFVTRLLRAMRDDTNAELARLGVED